MIAAATAAALACLLAAAAPPTVAWPVECVRTRSDASPHDGTSECKDARGRKVAGSLPATADAFTGTVRTLHPSGGVESVQRYEGGVEHGDWEEYFPDGSLKRRARFVAGLQDGDEVVYAEPGKKLFEARWQKGRKLWERAYWPNGQLRRTMGWVYGPGEPKRDEEGKLHGPVVHFDESGAKVLEETWDHGRLVQSKRAGP